MNGTLVHEDERDVGAEIAWKREGGHPILPTCRLAERLMIASVAHLSEPLERILIPRDLFLIESRSIGLKPLLPVR